MKRRQFLKSTCTLCTLAAVPGLASLALQSCAPMPMVRTRKDPDTGLVSVPVVKFAESNMVLLRLQNFNFDFLVIKRSDTEYKTLEMKCSHEEQPLTPTGKSISCASHGSIFDLDGKVLKPPATAPIRSFPTRVTGDKVEIAIR